MAPKDTSGKSNRYIPPGAKHPRTGGQNAQAERRGDVHDSRSHSRATTASQNNYRASGPSTDREHSGDRHEDRQTRNEHMGRFKPGLSEGAGDTDDSGGEGVGKGTDQEGLDDESGGESEGIEYLEPEVDDVPRKKSSKAKSGGSDLSFSTEELDNMSVDELKALIMLQQKARQSGDVRVSTPIADTSDASSHATSSRSRRTTSAQPVPTQVKRGDHKANKEAGSECGGEGDEESDGNGKAAPVKAVEGSDTSQINALKAHIRKGFCALGGWEDGNDVNATQYDETGKALYWTTESPVRLTPVWERTFEDNWKVWGKDFLDYCRKESEMDEVYRTYLKTVSDKVLKERLKAGPWKSFSKNGKAKAQGRFDESRLAKKTQMLERSRRDLKMIRRTGAREGTCLEDGAFDVVFAQGFQSPPMSDAEDPDTVVVLVPEYLIDEVGQIKDSLDLKASLGGKASTSTSEPNEKKTKHAIVDMPITKPGNNIFYPRWMFSQEWIDTHPAEWERALHMVDMDASVMPSIEPLINKYRPPGRTYTVKLPNTMKPRPPSVRRSISPSVQFRSRSVSPSVPLNAPNRALATDLVTQQAPIQTPVRSSVRIPLPTPALTRLADEGITIDPALFADTSDPTTRRQYQGDGDTFHAPNIVAQPVVPPAFPQKQPFQQPAGQPVPDQRITPPDLAPASSRDFFPGPSAPPPPLPSPPAIDAEGPEPIVENPKKRSRKSKPTVTKSTPKPRKRQAQVEPETLEENAEDKQEKSAPTTKKIKLLVGKK